MEIAAEIERAFSPTGLTDASLEELCQVQGIGIAKAARLAAAFELGRRFVVPAFDRRPVRHSADAYALLGPELGSQPEERVVLLLLDARSRLISAPTVAVGGLSSLSVHPRQVFREAIRRGASSLVLAHNHPSHDLTASQDDIETTARLREVGLMLGIPLVDHLIVIPGRFVSLRETTTLWADPGA